MQKPLHDARLPRIITTVGHENLPKTTGIASMTVPVIAVRKSSYTDGSLKADTAEENFREKSVFPLAGIDGPWYIYVYKQGVLPECSRAKLAQKTP